MSHRKIQLSQLEEIFQINFAAEGQPQPVILLAAPGIGKTQWFCNELPRVYAEALGLDPADVPVVIEKPMRRDASEIAGVTVPARMDDGSFETRFSRSPLLAQIEATGSEYGILLWDEIAAARDPEQKVAADSFDPNEHAIGGTKLPAGWIVVGTGNRAQDKSGATRLLSHLTNRTMVFEVVFDIMAWSKWAHDHGVNPIVIECAEAHADDGFFAAAVPTEDTAYCTPRSLVQAARHLDAFMASPKFTGTVSPLMESMLAANIGASAANTLCQWIAQRDHVPTAEEILRNPEGAKVPSQTGFQMIAANIAMAAVNDAQTAEAVLHYIVRLRTDLQVSLGTKLMKISSRAGWTVTDPLAAAFIAKFHELLPLVDC